MLTMLDYVDRIIDIKDKGLTREELGRIVSSGDEAEIEKVIEKMEAAGGYENLPSEE